MRRSLAFSCLLVGVQSQYYLVPILMYGPNNQFSGLLEAAAIAKLTRRTLLLPRYFARWYRDDLSNALVPFGDVFDVASLQAYVDCKKVSFSPERV